MGGSSSGRYRTRNRGAVEHSLPLDIRLLRRRGYVRPGCITSGTSRWSRHGEEVGSIGWQIDLSNPHLGAMTLRYVHDGKTVEEVVQLEAAPCRFGGHRYYFRCPRTWSRVEVLVPVDGRFMSRKAAKLTYLSQSQTPLDRLMAARDKAEERATGQGRYPVPRGRNRDRLWERYDALEAASCMMFSAEVSRRFGHLREFRDIIGEGFDGP